MAHYPQYLRPLDTRDPEFRNQCSRWAAQTQGEMMELVAATKKTIADSRALIAEADRMLPLLPLSRCLEEQADSFAVSDNNGQQFAHVYFAEKPDGRAAAKPLTRDEARWIAVNIVALASTLAARFKRAEAKVALS